MTTPKQIKCDRCGTCLGACTSKHFLPAGSMGEAILTAFRIRCRCGWVRAWRPTDKIGEHPLTEPQRIA